MLIKPLQSTPKSTTTTQLNQNSPPQTRIQNPLNHLSQTTNTSNTIPKFLRQSNTKEIRIEFKGLYNHKTDPKNTPNNPQTP